MNRNAPSLGIRRYAQGLIDAEVAAINLSDPDGLVMVRVFDRLRRPLSGLIGATGFNALLSRALALAKVEVAALNTVDLAADGSLQGMQRIPRDAVAEASALLMSYLLGLLSTFIGESLLMQILQDIGPTPALSQNAPPQQNKDDQRQSQN